MFWAARDDVNAPAEPDSTAVCGRWWMSTDTFVHSSDAADKNTSDRGFRTLTIPVFPDTLLVEIIPIYLSFLCIYYV